MRQYPFVGLFFRPPSRPCPAICGCLQSIQKKCTCSPGFRIRYARARSRPDPSLASPLHRRQIHVPVRPHTAQGALSSLSLSHSLSPPLSVSVLVSVSVSVSLSLPLSLSLSLPLSRTTPPLRSLCLSLALSLSLYLSIHLYLSTYPSPSPVALSLALHSLPAFFNKGSWRGGGGS